MPWVARAQAKAVKIGILSDMSGAYAEATGPGDVIAARFAIEDFNKQHPDIKVELISGDMLLKPDVGASIARQWYDNEGVDAIFDIPHSAVTLAVSTLAKEKDKVLITTSAGTADLSGKWCTPNYVQWTFDLWANSNGVVRGLMADKADTWYFIVADYISGHAMANDASGILKQLGGKELGRVTHAFPGTTDFSSQLVQAKASGAKVICLANAGDDTANCIKQAAEFGIPQSGVRLATLVLNDYIIKSVGLATAQNLVGTMPFVWNMNAETIAFADRFAPLYRGNKPNFYHAGSYSAVTHYLKAVAALGPEKAKESGRAAVAQMKAIPVDDPLYGKGTVREDGKYVHTEYVWQTKTPAESKGDWDWFKQLFAIPPDKAFKSMADGGCPLVKT
ncbi:MAG: ABC transporter substrate-binding protein [Proteobacteria bacterium]|nr:ABC transporter substrate-binding protein [Pseudomonadota bacterium]